MTYQVLAQKYRPQTFDDVIGQDAVIRTLRNSVQNQRVANAYLFSGPRGVGKTSLARLVSKTLNCTSSGKQKPCNKCDSCLEISRGNNIDVLEIDGASNNGVDEIRTLRENVKFSPSKGKFKIYIIDEVHMLSQGAFNALLKTLEEPPAHVKFIFATTEPHKVLPTIVSRCQKFDFKRISPSKILDCVVDVSKKEGISIDEKASSLIARASDGSLRDALVILDQMISFSGDKISSDDVIDLLGIVERDSIAQLADLVIKNDPAGAAKTLDIMINDGKDPLFIANSLIGYYRDIMILKTAGEATSDMAFTDEEIKTLKAQSKKVTLEEVLYILQSLSQCLILMKGAMFVRAPLEITLIRLTKRGTIMRLSEVLDKLENIEEGSYSVQDRSVEIDPLDNVIEDPKDNKAADIIEKDVSPERGDTDFKSIETLWKSVLNYIRKKKMSVYTFLAPAKPIEITKEKVVIGIDEDHKFNKEVLESNGNKDIIEEAMNKITGGLPRIKFVLTDNPETVKKEKTDKAKKVSRSRKEMNPIIEKAMDVFGGSVVRDLMEED